MSDTAPDTATTATTDSTPQPHGTDEAPDVAALQARIDELTAQSRKWEARAKDNYEARKELDAVRESIAGHEKAVADAEARAAEAEAKAVRLELAVDFGLSKEDTEALSKVTGDADALRAVAERLAARSTVGPHPHPQQGRGDGEAPVTSAEKFAAALEGLIQ